MRSPCMAALTAALVFLPVFGASPSSAQGNPREMDLGDYVLLWASGPYTASALCQLPEGPRRVARTIRIKPPRRARPGARHRIFIEPVGMGDVHCTNGLGAEELEIEGEATLEFTGPKRPDTARRDFEHHLRRDEGFELDVAAGQLKVGSGASPQRVDLKGGRLRIHRVSAGSDAARMLGDVGGLPTRTLELEAPDGTTFVFHAVYGVRRPAAP